eukprot:scaffold742_cov395-Prasinococcus_capsulatus_cf.AAC.8
MMSEPALHESGKLHTMSGKAAATSQVYIPAANVSESAHAGGAGVGAGAAFGLGDGRGLGKGAGAG